MGHYICLLLHLGCFSLRMPRSQRCVVVLAVRFYHHKVIVAAPQTTHTSVRLTGTSLPTMFPTVDAFCRIFCSYSLVSVRFAWTCSSSSFFSATSSSAFSLACTDRGSDKGFNIARQMYNQTVACREYTHVPSSSPRSSSALRSPVYSCCSPQNRLCHLNLNLQNIEADDGGATYVLPSPCTSR